MKTRLYFILFVCFSPLNICGQNIQQGMVRAINVNITNADFVYENTQNTQNLSNHYIGKRTNDVFYKLTFLVASNLWVEANFTSGSLATCVYVFDSNGNSIVSENDPILQSAMGLSVAVGTYYVVVEGAQVNGSIKTQITTKTTVLKKTEIDLGLINNEHIYENTQNTQTASKGYLGQPLATTNEIFYKITISRPMTIDISHCGSEITDTYINILTSSGSLIKYTDTNDNNLACPNAAASLTIPLVRGTYYIVSRGKSMNGNITTTIKTRIPKHIIELGHINDTLGFGNTQDTWQTWL